MDLWTGYLLAGAAAAALCIVRGLIIGREETAAYLGELRAVGIVPARATLTQVSVGLCLFSGLLWPVAAAALVFLLIGALVQKVRTTRAAGRRDRVRDA